MKHWVCESRLHRALELFISNYLYIYFSTAGFLFSIVQLVLNTSERPHILYIFSQKATAATATTAGDVSLSMCPALLCCMLFTCLLHIILYIYAVALSDSQVIQEITFGVGSCCWCVENRKSLRTHTHIQLKWPKSPFGIFENASELVHAPMTFIRI